jgi:hypothetical protein
MSDMAIVGEGLGGIIVVDSAVCSMPLAGLKPVILSSALASMSDMAIVGEGLGEGLIITSLETVSMFLASCQ